MEIGIFSCLDTTLWMLGVKVYYPMKGMLT